MQAGCSRCDDEFSFRLLYPLDGFQGRYCQVEFVGPTGRVRYEAQAPPLRGSAADLEDGGRCVEHGDQVHCIQLDGPTTIAAKNLCYRDSCALSLSFTIENTRRLTDFIGTESFDVIVTCGG
jgi:hypothetical protein